MRSVLASEHQQDQCTTVSGIARRGRHAGNGSARLRRQLHLAAAPAHRKHAVIEQPLAHRDVRSPFQISSSDGVVKIADLDADERAEVDLAAERHARVQERIQAAPCELRAGRVVVVHQLRVHLRTEVEEELRCAAFLRERRDLVLDRATSSPDPA